MLPAHRIETNEDLMNHNRPKLGNWRSAGMGRQKIGKTMKGAVKANILTIVVE